MSIHTNALKLAAKNLGINFREIDKHGAFVEIMKDEKVYHFISSYLPLNNQAINRICNDKEYTYNLLGSSINMPLTKGYLDANVSDIFEKYIEFKSIKEVVDDIERNFAYPLIAKMNRGSQGRNVYKVKNKEDLIEALARIYDKSNPDYDYVACIQDCIDIEREYRVITLDGVIELIYQKDNSQAKFVGNLSPLHWEGSRSILVEDKKTKNVIQEFIQPIYTIFELVFGGLDVAMDKYGNYWLIEVNTTIGLSYFVKDNGIEPIVRLYEKILLGLN